MFAKVGNPGTVIMREHRIASATSRPLEFGGDDSEGVPAPACSPSEHPTIMAWLAKSCSATRNVARHLPEDQTRRHSAPFSRLVLM